MAYTERDWDNTGKKVTKEDFKRMETGIKNNDNQINVLKANPNFTGTPTIQGQQVATTKKTTTNLTLESGFNAIRNTFVKVTDLMIGFNIVANTPSAQVAKGTVLCSNTGITDEIYFIVSGNDGNKYTLRNKSTKELVTDDTIPATCTSIVGGVTYVK